jgi:hypothetical protein
MRSLLLALASVALSSACVAAVPPASSSASASLTAAPTALNRVGRWRADVAALVPGMARLHPWLEHGVSRGELEAAVTALSARAATATDDEMLVGFLRIVAMVSARGCDAHTGAYIWGGDAYPVESLPLRLWWFDEGVVIVDALPAYRDLVGARIESMGGRAMPEILAVVDPLVPRDNDATVRLLMPRFLLIPQVLRGLGVIGSGDVRLGVSLGGSRRDVSLAPIAMRDYNAWAGAYGLHLPADQTVPYLSRIGDALWWRTDGSTLDVQYNRVDRLAQSTLDDLRSALRGPGIDRVVIDVRHNFGGEVSAVDPMVAVLKDPSVDRPGHLFVVTGRNTFSAAAMFVARLDASTSAIIVGEPMSGCPTSYGNARTLTLENTGIAVSVATLLEVSISADDRRPTIAPELAARLTPSAWAARQDVALAAIAAYRP